MTVIRCLTVFAAVTLAAALSAQAAPPADEAKPANDKATAAADDTQKKCQSYEPGVTVLTGKAQRLLTNVGLQLDNPICINVDEKNPAIYPLMKQVKTILFQQRENGEVERYDEFIGKTVTVTGTLYHQDTGYDTGNIVMRVADIETQKDVAHDGQ